MSDQYKCECDPEVGFFCVHCCLENNHIQDLQNQIVALQAENARYREALEFTTDMLKASQIWVTSYGVRHDSEKAIQKANEVLKGE